MAIPFSEIVASQKTFHKNGRHKRKFVPNNGKMSQIYDLLI